MTKLMVKLKMPDQIPEILKNKKKIIPGFFFYIFFVSIVYFFLMVLGILPIFIPRPINGKSMLPSYKEGEFIFTNIAIPLFAPIQLKRGTVIIIDNASFVNNSGLIESNLEKPSYIKRIIGLPGDKIMIREGLVYLNDRLINENYLNEPGYTNNWQGGFTEEGKVYVVPENNYFVMGDNRPLSSDSREFGFVPWYKIDSIVITKPNIK